MSYIEKMCFVNWRFRRFIQYSSLNLSPWLRRDYVVVVVVVVDDDDDDDDSLFGAAPMTCAGFVMSFL